MKINYCKLTGIILFYFFVIIVLTGCKEDENTPVQNDPPTGTLIYEKDSLNLEVPDTVTVSVQRSFVLDSLTYGSIRVEFDGETNVLNDSLNPNRMLKIHCNTFGNISFGTHQYQTAAAINMHQVANILNGYGQPFDLRFFMQIPYWPEDIHSDNSTKFIRFKNIKVYDTTGN